MDEVRFPPMRGTGSHVDASAVVLPSLAERATSMRELAATVNGGRKPEFGDKVLNPWASDGNPRRIGFFVQAKRVTGKFNPGLWYRVTDKHGHFWEINGDCAMLVECMSGNEVFP